MNRGKNEHYLITVSLRQLIFVQCLYNVCAVLFFISALIRYYCNDIEKVGQLDDILIRDLFIICKALIDFCIAYKMSTIIRIRMGYNKGCNLRYCFE